jgi:hypothetical protein
MHIVNPWMIYLITRCDAILTFALVTAVISGGATIICLFGRFLEWEEDTREGFKKAFKTCMTICVVSTFIAVLIPSKQTCIEMMIADKVTYESVDAGIDAVKEAADYVCDKIKEVQDADSDSN